MSTQPYQREMSVEAFFQFCQEHPEERYEYIHGYAYRLMAGGDSNHSRIKINLTGELRNALRGGSCLVFDSDMHVRIDESLYVLPDASVSCDERDHGYVQTLRHPCLVIEVLSPSMKNYDQVQKLAYYASVPAIEEYVLISTNEKLVLVHRRGQNESWVTHLYRARSSIEFTSVGVRLSLEVLYEHVIFPRGRLQRHIEHTTIKRFHSQRSRKGRHLKRRLCYSQEPRRFR
jgi:Uma2 family endonuclease